MRRAAFRLGLLLVLALGVFATSQAARSRSELQQLYTGWLALHGYAPSLDSDGDVRFMKEGRTYFIQVVESDEDYFRVALANIWPIESEAERVQVKDACETVNRDTKVVKAYTVNDNVWISLELFLPDQSDFGDVLERGLGAFESAVKTFVSEMTAG